MLNLCADGVQVNLSWDLLDIFAHRHVSVDLLIQLISYRMETKKT